MTKPRQSTLARMAEAIATTEAQWSFAERLEAARALGWAHAMPEPQEEMKFNEGGRDGR